jgi:hypothetical protein
MTLRRRAGQDHDAAPSSPSRRCEVIYSLRAKEEDMEEKDWNPDVGLVGGDGSGE